MTRTAARGIEFAHRIRVVSPQRSSQAPQWRALFAYGGSRTLPPGGPHAMQSCESQESSRSTGPHPPFSRWRSWPPTVTTGAFRVASLNAFRLDIGAPLHDIAWPCQYQRIRYAPRTIPTLTATRVYHEHSSVGGFRVNSHAPIIPKYYIYSTIFIDLCNTQTYEVGIYIQVS